MTLYSNLTVQKFNEILSKEILSDAETLLRNKLNILDIENLVKHTPRQFVKDRPLIVIYSLLKPMGLFEHFCEVGGKKITDNQYYLIAKIIELKYKVIFPTIMLPLSISEAFHIYDETRNKKVLNLIGSSAPSGKFQTVTNRLFKLGCYPVDVPSGLIVHQHDNNQVIGATHEMKAYNRQVTSVITANAHLVCDPNNFFQYSQTSYPGHNIHRNLTKSEIDSNVPEVVNQYKGHFRATRKKGLDLAITHLMSEHSHERFVEQLKQKVKDHEGLKFCSKCGVVTKRVDIRTCVDCDSKSCLVRITNEMVFNKFEKSVELARESIDIRFKPTAGYGAVVREQEQIAEALVPGDPDMYPPTTKEIKSDFYKE